MARPSQADTDGEQTLDRKALTEEQKLPAVVQQRTSKLNSAVLTMAKQATAFYLMTIFIPLCLQMQNVNLMKAVNIFEKYENGFSGLRLALLDLD